MSQTLSTITTRVKNLLANNGMITDAEVQLIIRAEHETILNDYSWSRRKRDQIINTVATYTTGTLLTSGTTATGSGTAWTGFASRFLRVGANTFFHRISSVASDTSMTLEQALPADAAAGSTYTIFRHVYSLSSDFGRSTNVTSDTRLVQVSREEIDRIDPYRTTTGTRPEVYTIRGLDGAGSDGTGNFEIEFWPVPSSVQAIRLEYLQTDDISATTDQPLYRADVLVYKAAEACCFFLLARTGDQAWQALSDRYHQRYQEQLEGAKQDDLARFSAVGHVRDAWAEGQRGDTFWIDKDPIRLR